MWDESEEDKREREAHCQERQSGEANVLGPPKKRQKAPSPPNADHIGTFCNDNYKPPQRSHPSRHYVLLEFLDYDM